MYSSESDQITNIIARNMRIDDVTAGDAKQRFLVRYRGQLYNQDTAQAYDQLAGLLRPHQLTPLFRKEGDQHVVLVLMGSLTRSLRESGSILYCSSSPYSAYYWPAHITRLAENIPVL